MEHRMFVRKNKRHQPRGIIVAKRNSSGQIVIGWSYANRKAGDRFSKRRGLAIAEARAEVGTDNRVPHEVLRCARRFRDEVLVNVYDLKRESVHIAGNCGFVDMGGVVCPYNPPEEEVAHNND